MKKQTDDLVKRAKRHESEAFTELMQLYMTDMYKVAYAILMNDEDAADAIGDTILICWEKMNQLFSPSPQSPHSICLFEGTLPKVFLCV
jgi:DNA-directed RNA polymerase specialized sigma24 family protein